MAARKLKRLQNKPRKTNAKSGNVSRATITALPIEMLLEIFKYIPAKSIFEGIRLVSDEWRDIAESSSLWKSVVLDGDISFAEACKYLQFARNTLRYLTLRNRDDASQIIQQVSQSNKFLEWISVVRLPNEADNSRKRKINLNAGPLCRLLTRCPNLRFFAWEGYTMRSCKFFRMLAAPPIRIGKQRGHAYRSAAVPPLVIEGPSTSAGQETERRATPPTLIEAAHPRSDSLLADEDQPTTSSGVFGNRKPITFQGSPTIAQLREYLLVTVIREMDRCALPMLNREEAANHVVDMALDNYFSSMEAKNNIFM